MGTVAIIPARGGSKRLPRKNVLPFLGRPMLAHPVDAARASGEFDAVIVSTEDSEIADAAHQAGAEVMARPASLADDKAGVVDVCLHVLDMLRAEGRPTETFCCIYATAVFITAQDLNHSHQMMAQMRADFVMGVSRYPIHPFKAMKTGNDGFLLPLWPEQATLKGQQLPALVASNGTFYWARTEAFERTRLFYGPALAGYEIPTERAVDMDTHDDYQNALRLARIVDGAEGGR